MKGYGHGYSGIIAPGGYSPIGIRPAVRKRELNIFSGLELWISPVMTDTFTSDDLQEEVFGPDDDDAPDFDEVLGTGQQIDTSFFDSPNFADFVKKARTANARDYEKRVASLVKTIAFARMQSTGGLPDAAALIYHGQNFASAAGMLADADKHAAKMIDIITSPENPYVAFAIAGLPLVAQLMRNHEAQLEKLPSRVKMTRAQRKALKAANPRPSAEITIPIIKKKLKVKIPFKLNLGILRTQSTDPGTLVNTVFSDDKVRRELRKQGIRFGE